METSNLSATNEQPAVTSTMPLLSLELQELMPLISSEAEAHQTEDMTYLSAVLQHVAQAKAQHRADDYVTSLKSLNKALKQLGTLISLRKEAGLT